MTKATQRASMHAVYFPEFSESAFNSQGSQGSKGGSLVAQTVKNLSAMPETLIRPLGWEDPVEKGMATHPGILASEIPWSYKRVRHNLTTKQKQQCKYEIMMH